MRKKFVCLIVVIIMVVSLGACGVSQKLEGKEFPAFKAEDFLGNEYTEAFFEENEATVVNFWFTGCQACVEEMPYLETMSQKLTEKNVKMIGICTDAGTEEIDGEVMKILKLNNVTFPNLKIKEGEEMDKLIKSITAFPTTVVIDSSGRIIGKPIVGALENESQEKLLNERIENVFKENSK